MPHLLQLQKKFPERVAAVTLNVDHDDADSEPSAELRQDVLLKLADLGAQGINIIATDAHEDVLAHHDLFAVPAVLVYGRDGKLLRKFEGEYTYEDDVVPVVEEALAASE